ncbi:MAG: hypothetical protein E7574_06035 [Ruminococcaceae bacterium]|nr:hypothetical protein [Oscillospiraceae bacterium]
MKKVDPVVVKETKYILSWVLILSALLQSIFLIIGEWDYTVLLGNLLSGVVAVLNFLLMGITIQNAVVKDESDAKNTIKASNLYRNMLLLIVMIIGVMLPYFNTWTVIIPLFFTRFAIIFRPLFDKK